MPLRIATDNIHRCIGRDGTESPERAAAVLREIGADVVALQEVGHRPRTPDNVLAYLAGSIDAEAIDGATLRGKRGSYGNALLSRVTLESVHRWDISVPPREPRGALDALFAINATALRVVATDLGLRPGDWHRVRLPSTPDTVELGYSYPHSPPAPQRCGTWDQIPRQCCNAPM